MTIAPTAIRLDRNTLRFEKIRHFAVVRGLRIKDLHNLFNKGASKPVHFSVFYRVCHGQCTSLRIQTWIERFFGAPEGTWWND